MEEMFEMILDGATLAAVDMTKSRIDSVREGEVDAAQLVISRSCKGRWDSRRGEWSFDVYVKEDGLPYVRAAKERIARGLQFTPGMKVGYVVTNAKESPMQVSAWLVDEIGDEPPDYDREYYAGRLAKSLGRITEAFGWKEQELLRGSRQSSLLDF
jgi:DNA polymerase I